MCGLVGIAGDLAFKDEATMKRLLLFDYFRGPDSTGLAVIRRTNEIMVAKLAVNPLDLFDALKFKSALNGSTSKAFIGHNRAATRGLVTNVNAHPYQYGDIVGAHNGTLDIKSVNRLEEALGEKFATDSMAMFAAIDRLGIEETIGLCETGKDSSTGAWSLVWYDQVNDTLNFLRNKHRPMWLAYQKDMKRIFWASEWLIIDHSLRMSSTEYDLHPNVVGKDTYKYLATEEDFLYSFKLGDLLAGLDTVCQPVLKKIEGREPAPVLSYSGANPFQRQGMGALTTIHATRTDSTTQSLGVKKEMSVVHLLGSTARPFAGLLTFEEFIEASKYGCAWCEGPIEFDHPGLTFYERENMFICSGCSGNGAADPLKDNPPATRMYLKAASMEDLLGVV